MAVFPELCLTGYAIDDLLLQDTLLDAVAGRDRRGGRGVGRPAAGARRRRAAACTAPGCSTARSSSTAAGSSAWRRSPTCRPTASSTSAATSRPATTGAARRSSSAAPRCRSAPTCSSRPPTCPASTCTSRSARTCGCRSRRAPRPRWPARRCWPTCPAARSPSPAPRTAGCWSAAPARAATRRTSSRPPARASRRTDLSLGRPDDGLRVRRAARPRAERFPDGPRAPSPTSTSTGSAQERLRQGTFDDNRRTHDAARRRVPHRRVRARRRRRGDIGLRRKVDRFPFVPDDAERLALDCYEAYNIQVSGLEQRLHAIGQPQGRHRRQRRPRLHARADRRAPRRWTGSAARAATSTRSRCRASRPATPRSPTPPGSRSRSASPSRSSTSPPAARQMLADLDHPFADGEPVYDVTFENVQAGLRTDYLFRLANHRGGIVRRHRRPVRARARAGAPTASATRCRTTTSTPACPRR